MKVFFDTIGCRLNQAEIEQMAGEFRSAGHQIIENAAEADLVIINTCTVTAAAASDSRQKVRQAHRAGAKEIVLTGCLATLEPEASEALPGVKRVFTNHEKALIPSLLIGKTEDFDLEPLARIPLPGDRKRTRAFIKVQDGCDNFCTFCVTRLARGKGVSLPKEHVLREVRAAVEGGTHEVVLSGVHLGSWGKDLGEAETLTDLVQYLLANTGIERLRLSSTEPWGLDERFFDLWQDPRMCRHLHLPLQSGSAQVLRRMARHTTPQKFSSLVAFARERIPDVAITTDIIVGFPGETDEEFNESLKFVQEMEFASGHVFKYSLRQGTAAAKLPNRVHGSLAHERSQRMREILDISARRFAENYVNRESAVLWETATQMTAAIWNMSGLTDNYLQVYALAESNRCNKIDRVKIQRHEGGILVANILD
jgi:threonylcarbamoyladenosine tRNA methylthiotransferase MtaB